MVFRTLSILYMYLGIGKDGLIHISKMRGRKVELGNRYYLKYDNQQKYFLMDNHILCIVIYFVV